MAKDELSTVEGKMNLKREQVARLNSKYRIIRFRGAVLYATENGWEPLDTDEFARISYEVLGSATRMTQIKDLQHYYFTSAPDLTKYAHYIATPDGQVWNMKKLKFTNGISADDCVYVTAINPTDGNSHRKWLEEVTLGDKELADNIMWALAPVFMHKKPFGVWWFLGAGGNGKSTVLKSLYQIFGGEDRAPFTQLTLSEIEDGRDIPTMAGMLGNICVESHDGHIKDAGNYKHLADHDKMKTHKMRTNDNIKVDGNIHTVFNTNNIPTFGDKTKAIRDRTFTLPFNASFPRDMNFDEKLWSQKNFLSDFFGELLRCTVAIKNNGYFYKLSALSARAKQEYDEEANSTETYLRELIEQEIWGFDSFAPLYNDYKQWCEERGSTTLGRKALAQAAKYLEFDRKSFRQDDQLIKKYVWGNTNFLDLTEVRHRWGLYQKTDSDVELAVVNATDETLNNLLNFIK